jgi:hypothetical protein
MTVQGSNLYKNHGMMGSRSCETIFSVQIGHILLIAWFNKKTRSVVERLSRGIIY